MTKPVGKLRIADRTGKYKFRATREVSRFSRRSCRTEEARGQATGFEPIQHVLPSPLRSLPLELFACFGPPRRRSCGVSVRLWDATMRPCTAAAALLPGRKRPEPSRSPFAVGTGFNGAACPSRFAYLCRTRGRCLE